MSSIISYTRCQKCKSVFNIDELYDDPDGIGKICIDRIECHKREKGNTERANPARKPTR